jgi:hypothetical protein
MPRSEGVQPGRMSGFEVYQCGADPSSYACFDLGRTRFLSQCGGNRCGLDWRPVPGLSI